MPAGPPRTPSPAPLEVRPAEVGRAAGPQRQDVHLLEDRLAHVRHDQTAARRIEGEPPGHPQARGQQLRAAAPRSPGSRRTILPFSRAGVLARLGSGAESEACVEQPVRAEGHVASHVHAASARQRQQRARMAWAPSVTGTELIQVHAPVLARVEHVDAPARPVSRRESERERAALVSELVLRREQPDEPASVEHEAPGAVATHCARRARRVRAHRKRAAPARSPVTCTGWRNSPTGVSPRGPAATAGGATAARRRDQRRDSPYFSNSNPRLDPYARLNSAPERNICLTWTMHEAFEGCPVRGRAVLKLWAGSVDTTTRSRIPAPGRIPRPDPTVPRCTAQSPQVAFRPQQVAKTRARSTRGRLRRPEGGPRKARMKTRVITLLLAAGLLAVAALTALSIPAAAQTQTVYVRLADGSVVPVQVDVPPGSSLDDIQLPGTPVPRARAHAHADAHRRPPRAFRSRPRRTSRRRPRRTTTGRAPTAARRRSTRTPDAGSSRTATAPASSSARSRVELRMRSPARSVAAAARPSATPTARRRRATPASSTCCPAPPRPPGSPTS